MAEDTMKVVCPHCKETLRTRRPDTPGKYKFRCKKCGEGFSVTVEDEAPVKDEAPAKEETPTATVVVKQRGTVLELYRRRRVFKDEHLKLHVGDNVIGAQSDEAASDIMVDDSYMSRRSVCINMEMVSAGTFKYTFTLLRTSNPAYYNGKEIINGTSREMKDKDSFTIGKTTFYVKKK